MSNDPDYTFCASGGSTCLFEGQKLVSYIHRDYEEHGGVSKIYTNSIQCTDPNFNSYSLTHSQPMPYTDTEHNCYYTDVPEDILNPGPDFLDDNGNPNPEIWTECAVEGKTCDPQYGQNVDILYGSDGKYYYAKDDQKLCVYSLFVAPEPTSSDSPRKCYWRPKYVPPPPPPPPQPIPPPPPPPPSSPPSSSPQPQPPSSSPPSPPPSSSPNTVPIPSNPSDTTGGTGSTGPIVVNDQWPDGVEPPIENTEVETDDSDWSWLWWSIGGIALILLLVGIGIFVYFLVVRRGAGTSGAVGSVNTTSTTGTIGAALIGFRLR